MITYRKLKQDQFDMIRFIDRTEMVGSIYYLENGKLTLKSENYNIPPWSANRISELKGYLMELYQRNAFIIGSFENQKIIGLMALDNRKRGIQKNKYQLVMLHVGNGYRRRGIGKILMEMAINKAIEWGGKYLYISASPAENAIKFYLRFGAFISKEIEQDLYEKEPDDIHLELKL